MDEVEGVGKGSVRRAGESGIASAVGNEGSSSNVDGASYDPVE